MVPWPRIQCPSSRWRDLDDALLHPHELLADDVALLLRVAHVRQGVRNCSSACFDRDRARAQAVEHAADELGFALAHQPGIHVDAAHAVRAQRPQAERESHGGIHAAADEEEDVAIARRLADLALRSSGTRCRGSQSFTQPQMSKRKFERTALPVGGVNHLGMELHAVEAALGVWRWRRWRRCGAAPRCENPGGRPATTSRWLIQICWRAAQAVEERRPRTASRVRSVARPYSPLSPLLHPAAQQVRHELLAVADAQHGMSGVQDGRIDRGAAGIVNAGRAAGNDQAFARRQFAAGVSLRRTSAYTPRSRTLRAMRWQYCPPASRTVICGALI